MQFWVGVNTNHLDDVLIVEFSVILIKNATLHTSQDSKNIFKDIIGNKSDRTVSFSLGNNLSKTLIFFI